MIENKVKIELKKILPRSKFNQKKKTYFRRNFRLI